MSPTSQLKSKNWRIVIPNLQQYKNSSLERLLELKQLILERLKHRPQDKRSHMKSQFQRGLRYYNIAVQHHANGIPHLDILLIYQKSIQRQLRDFNFLLKPGHVTTYRRLNQAILEYGRKQDKQPVTNISPDQFIPNDIQLQNQKQSNNDSNVSNKAHNESNNYQNPSKIINTFSSIIQVQELKKDSYSYLYDKMKQDPLHFNLQQYVQYHQLSKYISNWSAIKTKLKDMQTAAANLKLKHKKGFKHINRALIEANLNSDELKVYDSWKGYQTIVDYLNQIITYGYARPLKTRNLLITGRPNVGKTSLFEADLNRTYNCVENYVSVYPMGTRTWWPNYKPQVYKLILWNEAKLTAYSYDTVLRVLEGSKVDLPYKGGSVLKYDNPLVIMTSNMTLEEMIQQKFNYSQSYRQLARKNLAVRVQNVIVPEGYDLFLLQKLLIK